jgi:hypothetical protein
VALYGLAAALVIQHLFIFWQRLVSQTLLEPVVAMRWLGALLLLLVLRSMRRRGVPMLRGRVAMSFWLAVLLLHIQVAPLPQAPQGDSTTAGGLPWAVSGGVGAAPLLFSLAVFSVFLALGQEAPIQGLSVSRAELLSGTYRRAADPRAFPHLLSRPPPLA